MRPIQIQRAARHKEGWKLRFGYNGLITTVIINCPQLDTALEAGCSQAWEIFQAMSNFNRGIEPPKS